MTRLAGLRIAVIGGDRRELEICRLAVAAGAEVAACGLPWPASGLDLVRRCDTPGEALDAAAVCLLPLPLPGDDGRLHAPAAPGPIRPLAGDFARMWPGARIIAGSINPALLAEAAAGSVRVASYGGDREGRQARAVAIAEGAAGRLIAATDHTLHGARIAVLGNGVLGAAMADLLGAFGAHTSVFARAPSRPGDRPLAELAASAPRLDVLLSTIPAAVVDAATLLALPPHALVVDLAAPACLAPLAERLGRRTLRALGLGDTAPVTVGAIQWRQILALLGDTAEVSDVPPA